jgi:hypothetical protein
MVSDKSISQIANLVAAVLNHGFNSTGLSANMNLVLSLNDCLVSGFTSEQKAFDKLYALNQAAVNDRYGSDVETTGKYTDEDLWTKPGYYHHFICGPNHYQMLKTLRCFIYQCSEDINRNNQLLQGLQELETSIKDLIISSLDLYNDAIWQ